MSTPATLDEDRAHLLHPLHHPSAYAGTRIWVSGDGALIKDSDGREYIDGLSGLWNVNVGHGRRELGEVASRQMATLAFHSTYAGGSNEPAIALAERLSGLVYPSINTFFFTSGGAEASETSFKTARFYWKALGRPDKIKIISRHRAYHGLTLAAMSATGLSAFWPMFEPRTPGFLHIDAPDPYRFVNPDPGVSLGVAAANKLEEAILREGPETVAAFIAEPVQGAGGVIVPPPDYFRRIREICDQARRALHRRRGDHRVRPDRYAGSDWSTGRRGPGHHPVRQRDHERVRAAWRHRRVGLRSATPSTRPGRQTLDARVHLLGTPDVLRGGTRGTSTSSSASTSWSERRTAARGCSGNCGRWSRWTEWATSAARG